MGCENPESDHLHTQFHYMPFFICLKVETGEVFGIPPFTESKGSTVADAGSVGVKKHKVLERSGGARFQ